MLNVQGSQPIQTFHSRNLLWHRNGIAAPLGLPLVARSRKGMQCIPSFASLIAECALGYPNYPSLVLSILRVFVSHATADNLCQ